MTLDEWKAEQLAKAPELTPEQIALLRRVLAKS